jgi:putative DNA primase/helicase
LANELENLSSPMKAFIKERCVVAPEQSIGCKRLYGVWCEWNAQNGQWSLPPGNLFSRDLRAAVPTVSVKQPRGVDGKQVRVFNGIGLQS